MSLESFKTKIRSMKKIIILAITGLIAWSCTQNEPLLYTAKPAVYFNELSNDADSVIYSFTTTVDERDTVYISVKLLGAIPEDKTFKISVDEEASTAKAGVHYEALRESFVYPAGKVTVNVPFYMLYSADLDTSLLSLDFAIESNDDMDAGYSDHVQGRIIITNQLFKPVYWDYPMSLYFGEYSRVKHQICTDIMGHDFPLTLEEAQYWNGETIYGYWMRAGREVAEYIASHEVYDENGELISDWIPF